MPTLTCEGCGKEFDDQMTACPDCEKPIGDADDAPGYDVRKSADKFSDGMRLINEKNYEEAVAAFTEAISLRPDPADIYFTYRARAYRNLGRHEEADADLKILTSKQRPGQRASQGSVTTATSTSRAYTPTKERQMRYAAPNADFFESLFDMSFTAFVTTQIVKLLYILSIAIASLLALVIIVSGFQFSGAVGIIALFVVAPLVFFPIVIYSRVILELIIVLFRIAEHAAEIAEQGRRENNR